MRRISIMVLLLAASVPAICAGHTLSVSGNRIVLDGRKGQVLYRSSGDLDGDGKAETVFSMSPSDDRSSPIIVAAKLERLRWRVIVTREDGCYDLRADVTDVNGDGRAEIVARGVSGDGHGWCNILALRNGRLAGLGSFHATVLRDLNHDGVPEILSTEAIATMCLGDQWLTIYKWDGRAFVDVSRRFPKAYHYVIRHISHIIKDNQDAVPSDVASLYYYLGLAYEYAGQPTKAKIQYAIAYRLTPDADAVQQAFRRTWHIKAK